MFISKKSFVLCALGVSFLLGSSAYASDWGYVSTKGPAFWGTLSTKYALCASGEEQSPIDIETSDTVSANDVKLAVNYSQNSKFYEINNGHTVQAMPIAEDSFITINGDHYDFLQMHFHVGSENLIDNHQYRAEFHFVNKDKNGHLAVVAVLVKEGAFNPNLQQFLNNAPVDKGSMYFKMLQMDMAALLPRNTGDYYTYKGSLTTPPCTEGVRWFVFPEAITASEAQLKELASLYNHNARPRQLIGNRIVKHVVITPTADDTTQQDHNAPMGAQD